IHKSWISLSGSHRLRVSTYSDFGTSPYSLRCDRTIHTLETSGWSASGETWLYTEESCEEMQTTISKAMLGSGTRVAGSGSGPALKLPLDEVNEPARGVHPLGEELPAFLA